MSEEVDSPEFKLALLKMEEALADLTHEQTILDVIEVAPDGLEAAEAIRGVEAILDRLLEHRDAAFLHMERLEADAENVSAADGLAAMLRYHEYAGSVTVVKSIIRLLKRRNGDL